ncbi:unnamed protein product, partial [Onchocerca ochengi]
ALQQGHTSVIVSMRTCWLKLGSSGGLYKNARRL